MSNCFLEFEVSKHRSFDKLKAFFYAIKAEKEQGVLDSADAKWQCYFDEDILRKFWRPSEEEVRDYARLWTETPVEQRLTEPKLRTPWDFESMIEAFSNGEYEFMSCEKITDQAARMEYAPFAWPYGGSDAFRALIEYCGFKVIAEET